MQTSYKRHTSVAPQSVWRARSAHHDAQCRRPTLQQPDVGAAAVGRSWFSAVAVSLSSHRIVPLGHLCLRRWGRTGSWSRRKRINVHSCKIKKNQCRYKSPLDLRLSVVSRRLWGAPAAVRDDPAQYVQVSTVCRLCGQFCQLQMGQPVGQALGQSVRTS